MVADEILVAVGRRPRTQDLGLESVGLAPGRYIDTDDSLRSIAVQAGWLYAIGDVTGRALLTHMGKYHARIAADHILGRDAHVDERAIPRVVFTDPQVAAVGLTEAAALEEGIDARAISYDTGGVAGAYVSRTEVTGTSQIVVDESRRVIVGTTLTGPGVGEMLHAATVAIVAEVPLHILWHAVPSFPTISEVWLRLLETYESQTDSVLVQGGKR
jgi:pyruvate/2-oxoglutarate dehydrogenase complex dihydrolipoamide dehydrogenase (E3) component